MSSYRWPVFIVLILFVAGLPIAGLRLTRTLKRIHQDIKFDNAVSMVVSELRSARSTAVAQKRYVAVVMPTAQDANLGGVADIEYKARSMRICFVDGHPDYDAAGARYRGRFAGYVGDRAWQFLPPPFFIGYTASHGEYPANAGKGGCNVVSGIPFPAAESVIRLDHVRAVIFGPSGETLSSPQGDGAQSMDTEIIIHRGKLENGSKLLRWGVDAYIRAITVYQLSGECRVQ